MSKLIKKIELNKEYLNDCGDIIKVLFRAPYSDFIGVLYVYETTMKFSGRKIILTATRKNDEDYIIVDGLKEKE